MDVDNKPPVVSEGASALAQGGATVTFEVEDGGGIIRRADLSVDSGEWHSVFPEDGIADSGRETYRLSVPLAGAGEHTISFRVFDASGNVSSRRLVVRR